MDYRKMILLTTTFLAMLSVLVYAGAEENIAGSLYCLYLTVRSALAVGMLLLVVLAAVVYAVGQVLGAETRARASVWATAMFVGAIIGALLYILLPFILTTLFSGDPMADYIKDPSSVPMGSVSCGTS